MRKSKRTKTIKKSNKCIYTDETKRILKRTRRIRELNKKFLKTVKSK
jgi:hypothetical protein